MIAQKRKINWNNPVYLDRETAAQHGVVAAYPGKGYGSQRLFDLRNRNHGTLTNGPAWTTGKFGEPAISYDAASSHYTTCGKLTPLASVSTATIVTWVYRGATTDQCAVGQITAPYRFNILWSNYLSGTVFVQAENGGGGSFPSFTATNIGWNQIALSYNGALSGLDRCASYFNAAPQTLTKLFGGDDPATSLASSANQGTFDFGRDAVSTFYGSPVANTVVSSLALTATQIAELYRNPFLLYWQPSPRKLFFFRQTTAVRRQAKAASKVRRLVLRR